MSKSKRVNFTAGRVSAFTCPPDKPQVFMWDSGAPGLGLRATPAGTAAYIFQYRLRDTTGRITLGNREAWDIEQAREEAHRLTVMVDKGIDPRQDKEDKAEAHAAKLRAKEERAKEEARRAITVGELWGRYIEERKHKWGKHSLADHHKAMQAPGLPRKRSKQLTAPGALYSLHDVRLVDLTTERLQAWLRTEAKTRPTVAARAYRLLRAFLNWASEQPELKGLANTEAVNAQKVKENIPPSNAKDDALEREQLAVWFAEVRKLPNRNASVYLQALLLTGARPESLRALRWKDVDFQWKRLTIRDKVASYGGKDGTRTIPLTPYLASLLSNHRRAANVRTIHDGQAALSPWVFASPTSASGYMTEPSKPNARLCAMAGLPHITPHGLRRSFGTLSEWVECPDGIAKQIMGHTPNSIAEKHYRVRPLDLLRTWHTKIEGWILEQAGIEQPNEAEAAPTVRRAK